MKHIFRLSKAKEQLERLQILIQNERNWVVGKWGEEAVHNLELAYELHLLYTRANNLIGQILSHETKARTYIVTDCRYLKTPHT